uniref:Tnf receptor associated factor n=1 Tax=Rhipicephalus appendiculatus TaxID=34631 RepID=A0A131YWY9_RHIAP
MATHRYTCVGFSPKIDWKCIEFLLPMPVYRICSICGIVPDMIFSLECGHVFCTTCMNELMLNSPVVVCPLDKGSFEEGSVSRDSSSQAYVCGCKSYCLNKGSGCNYVGPVSEMVEHYYSECSHHLVHCRTCKKPVARMNVMAHLRSGCKSDVMATNQAPSATASGGSDADGSLSTLVSKIENLENVLLTRTNRLEEILRERVTVGVQPPPAPVLNSEVARAESRSRPDTTATADTTTQAGEEQQPDVVSTSSTSLSEANGHVTPVTNGDATVGKSPNHSREESPSEPQLNGLNSEHEDQAVVESTSGAAEAEPSTGPNAFFTYDWVVKPFRKYRNAPLQVFTSDVLTVGENGYRVKLEGKFHDLGDSSLYLALYLRIVKGPNDAALEWPFNRKCTFVLLHHKQRTRDVSFDVFALKDVEERQNAANTVLKRPKKKENDSIGLDRCLSVTQMLQSGFVKNNEFRVRFVVE